MKDKGPGESFAPDKKDFQRVKRIAKDRKLTRVGNVHTHVITPLLFSQIRNASTELRQSDIGEFCYPSPEDLKYARRFNDIIRCIITVLFISEKAEGQITAEVWHDQFGNVLKEKLGNER
jgi:hypothetical protein